MAQTFMAAGAEIKEVGTKEGSEESGKDKVNPTMMSLLVDRKSFIFNTLKGFGIPRLSVNKVEVLEESMQGKRLVITCSLILNNGEIPTHALIDCGATGIACMD
jgi:hypothetical protein